MTQRTTGSGQRAAGSGQRTTASGYGQQIAELFRCVVSIADVVLAIESPILSGMRTEHRSGLTLIEVIVAMLVFAIGGLGLAAGSAVVVKQIGLNNLRSNALTIARSRAEQAIASGCGSIASGRDRKLGVRSVWTVTGGSAETLEQTLERQSALGLHSDRFLSAIPCD